MRSSTSQAVLEEKMGSVTFLGTYNKLWKTTVEKLTDILQEEDADEDKVEQERVATVQKTSLMYLRFIKIANNFIDCYENILQPQKRILLRNFVDNTIGRVLELKHELVSLEFSEFHFLDDKLLSAKMVPNPTDITSLTNYQLYDIGLAVGKILDDDKKLKYLNETWKPPLRYSFPTRAEGKQNRKFRREWLEQYNWLAYSELSSGGFCKMCVLLHQLELELEIRSEFIVGVEISVCCLSLTLRLSQQLQSPKQDLSSALANVSQVLDTFRSKPWSEIRMPPKEAWGTIQAHERARRGRVAFVEAQKLYEMKEENKMKEYRKSLKIDLTENTQPSVTEETDKFHVLHLLDSLKKDRRDAIDKNEREFLEATEAIKKDMLTYEAPKVIEELQAKIREYFEKYRQKHGEYPTYPTEEEGGSTAMLQTAIDDDNELEKPKNGALGKEKVIENKKEDKDVKEDAFERDLGKKGKKGGKKAGKKGGKKDKGKGKGKKEKDLTPNRSFESLVEELIKERIIINYPKFNLSDFVGDYNYVGSMKQYECDPEKEPVPCLGDIRRVVNEYCILPMGSPAIHSKGAFTKSVLFVGPHGCGKKSLIYAICNEIGATLMDLSAENVNGKYPGKEGLDMLMHLVYKVGRLAQPTVIYIKDAENYFWRKQPATSILAEAVRLKKELPKLMKAITNDDRILICGTSVTPFDVDLKGMSSCYSKIICIYSPDHNCRRGSQLQN
ncbi:dynein regulatory complex protein 11-like [Uloborus diversus]|uniref:dynein regulatory complex protein 11-like n=1 Tax=Uloborus diversus TaxID=327109 RepID=UPI002409F29E|nr:dynein regulatory complex protein 11-like [Uloborus diversus]